MANPITDLIERIKAADEAYYNQNNPVMSDAEYDRLVAQYRAITGKDWEYLGEASEQLTRVPHSAPMLSLEKHTTIEALVKWAPADGQYVLTPKIDGVSCALRYQDGKLVQALSRGDGNVGESTLQSLQAILLAGLLPQRVGAPFDRGAVEIRGEVYIPLALFPLVGGANPRNSAAGLLRRQSADPRQAHLRFIAYRVLGTKHSYYEEVLDDLQAAGFEVPPRMVLTRESFAHKTAEELHPNHWHPSNLAYEIDGVVIVHNDLQVQESLGETGHHPRWGCAFKFATDEVETEILAVEWNASRTGLVVPTYVFRAVHLEGTVVTRATGHNLEQFQKLNATVKDSVMVTKANQIIPQVVRLVSKNAHEGLSYPTQCPSCGHGLRVSLPHLLCINQSCPEKLKGLLVNAAKRSNLDINGLGEEVAEAIVSAKLVSNLADLFKLTEGQLAEMDFGKGTFGMARAKKLVKAIEGAKEKPWNVVLHSLGCPGLGEPECDLIASRFSLYDMIATMSPVTLKMELIGMKGIGEKTAITFVSWLQANFDWLYEITDYLKTKPEVKDLAAQPLLGYTVVLTGSFSQPRTVYEKQLKALGAVVAGSCSANTTYLVLGEGGEGTSKHQGAIKHKIPIIDEAQLKALLSQ